jgi:DNA-binding MarR family transcriptional regulator
MYAFENRRDDHCDDVLLALKRISRAIDIHSRRLMQTTGLTGPQVLVLQILKRRGTPMPINELAESASLSQGTVTSILDRLLKKQLVEKTRGIQDKRKVYVSLTASAQTTLGPDWTPLQQHFIHSFKELQEWEQTLIVSSLQRVAQMMSRDELEIDALLDQQNPVLPPVSSTALDE